MAADNCTLVSHQFNLILSIYLTLLHYGQSPIAINISKNCIALWAYWAVNGIIIVMIYYQCIIECNQCHHLSSTFSIDHYNNHCGQNENQHENKKELIIVLQLLGPSSVWWNPHSNVLIHRSIVSSNSQNRLVRLFVGLSVTKKSRIQSIT